jgi:ornithine carrier protein
MVGKFVEYPFDTVKVRLQTQSVENPLFKRPMDCLKATIKEEGMKGLFKVKIIYDLKERNEEAYILMLL